MPDTPYSLADYQALSKDPVQYAIINIFRKQAPVLDLLRITTKGLFTVPSIRTKNLPDVHTRNIGEAYQHSKAEFEPYTEAVTFLGSMIDIPKEFIGAKNQLVNQSAVQIQSHAVSGAAKLNDMIINADPTTDPKVHTAGLRYRLIHDLSSTQTVLGGGLDVSPDAVGLSANFDTLLDAVDELISLTGNGQCSALLMNKAMRQRFTAAARQKGLFAQTKDVLGRTITSYGEGGPVLFDMARKRPDVVGDIIGNTELDDGSAVTGGDATSIYAFYADGSDEWLSLWEFEKMKTTPIGLLEDGTAYRWIFDWSLGMFFANPTAIARLPGIVAK